jgi:hypothetical protein
MGSSRVFAAKAGISLHCKVRERTPDFHSGSSC